MSIYEAMSDGLSGTLRSMVKSSGEELKPSGEVIEVDPANVKDDLISKTLTLYHGTSMKNAQKIMEEGLKNSTMSPRWYMLSDNEDDAIFHAYGSESPTIVKFIVPVSNDRWEGYPHLWPPAGPSGSFHGKWYAPKDKLASVYAVSAYLISDDDMNRVRSMTIKR